MLKQSIMRIVNVPGTSTSFDGVAQDWLMQAALLFGNDIVGNDAAQPAYPQANIKAMEDLKKSFEVPDVPTGDDKNDEPSLPALQTDVGFSMVEQHGDEYLQSMGLDTILFINDKMVVDPGQTALTLVSIPPEEETEKLVLQSSYLYPEHNFTYIFINVSRWAPQWGGDEFYLDKIGVIVLPMAECQKEEPKIETLDQTTAASLLGVNGCSTKAVKYSLVGKPRFHTAEYTANLQDGPIRQGLDKLASIIDGESEMKIDLVHPIYEEKDNLSLDASVRILENCTEGWTRDATKNPLSIYFEKSPKTWVTSTTTTSSFTSRTQFKMSLTTTTSSLVRHRMTSSKAC